MKPKKIYLLIFFLIFTLSPYLALSKEEQKEDSSKLTVEADDSIEWFENEKYYLAKGNVKLIKDGIMLKANFVKALYDEENGKNVLTKIIAKTNVILTKGKARASGQFMTYDLNSKIVLITGPFQTFSSPSGYIESSKMIKFNDLNKKAEASGNVKINLPNKTTIFGENVKADFTGKEQSLNKATVKGNVIVENSKKRQKSKADFGAYNSSNEVIELTGNVVIINKKSTIRGSKGIINLKSGTSNLIGSRKKGQRVKGVFLPTKNKVNGD